MVKAAILDCGFFYRDFYLLSGIFNKDIEVVCARGEEEIEITVT